MSGETGHREIDRHRGQESAVRDWDALAESAGAPPFLHPGWIVAWVRAFGRGELYLVETRRDDALAAVLPMLRRGNSLRAPANWHTPMFGPVAVDAGAREELLGSLFARPWSSVELNLLADDQDGLGGVRQAAHAERRMVLSRTVARSPFVALAGDFDDYERTLSRNRRKALRGHRRRLAQEGDLRFEINDGREGLEDLLEQAFAVEASGWKGRKGTAIASRPETRGFYTDIARWAAEQGWLRLAFLRLDGRPIACDFALEHGGIWYTLKAGFDEEFRSFGPGALLLRDEIAHCCERPDVSRMELLGHEDSFKASWTDHHSDRTWMKVFSARPAGVLHWTANAMRERARPAWRRLKGSLG